MRLVIINYNRGKKMNEYTEFKECFKDYLNEYDLEAGSIEDLSLEIRQCEHNYNNSDKTSGQWWLCYQDCLNYVKRWYIEDVMDTKEELVEEFLNNIPDTTILSDYYDKEITFEDVVNKFEVVFWNVIDKMYNNVR